MEVNSFEIKEKLNNGWIPGRSFFISLIEKNDKENLIIILDYGFFLDEVDNVEDTEIFRIFLERGADPSERSKNAEIKRLIDIYIKRINKYEDIKLYRNCINNKLTGIDYNKREDVYEIYSKANDCKFCFTIDEINKLKHPAIPFTNEAIPMYFFKFLNVEESSIDEIYKLYPHFNMDTVLLSLINKEKFVKMVNKKFMLNIKNLTWELIFNELIKQLDKDELIKVGKLIKYLQSIK
jgi:hypothetical protein